MIELILYKINFIRKNDLENEIVFFFVKFSSLVEYRDFSRKDKPERFCKFELISFRFILCTLLVSIDFVISRKCES